MIPKKPAPDLIRGGSRLSDKIMLQQEALGPLRRDRVALRPSSTLFRGQPWPGNEQEQAKFEHVHI